MASSDKGRSAIVNMFSTMKGYPEELSAHFGHEAIVVENAKYVEM
jgi:hypothetical protein